ncbi:MAG TPA: DUF1015 domain-containing protein [Thermoleophilia bacterium]|jgi:uncharacterized protein (DUF1015 family)|nr:DUF1015 domain-containing protein [Thermoleophilia bacterium]
MTPAPDADAQHSAAPAAGGRLALAPFRGLRFAPARVGDPAAVISPPYDMIDPIQAHRLARSGVHNIVRLILPELDEPDPRLRYRRAARTLREWREEKALVLDEEPTLYVYEQRQPSGLLQRGLIGALELPADDAGPVLPHEDVVDAVVADRQALMHALGANPEPILLTYQGGGPASDLVERYADRDHNPAAHPVVEAVMEDGTHHRLWAITDPAEHAEIAADLAPRRSLIADGHHRYSAYQRLAGLRRPGTDHGLALLVDSERHPLAVRGIHRWLPDLPAVPAMEAAGKSFAVKPVDGGYRAAMDELGAIPPDRIAFAVVAGQQAWLVADPAPDLLAEAIPGGRPEAWRTLDATVLHYALAGAVWGIPDTADHIRFDHDPRHAVVEAHRHHGLAVLVRPVAEETVAGLAAAGVRMPRKSTSFAPKPATGLVMRLLDET